jgi:hypothetical protein
MHGEWLWADASSMSDMRNSVFYPKISLYRKKLNQFHTKALVFLSWPTPVKGWQKFFRMKPIRVKVMTGQIIPTILVTRPQLEPPPRASKRKSATRPRTGASQRPRNLWQTQVLSALAVKSLFPQMQVMSHSRQKWLGTEQNHLQICSYSDIVGLN